MSAYAELTDEELWQANSNVLNGVWKNWTGMTHPWPTKFELRTEMARRNSEGGSWVTMCSTCGEWYAITDPDTHADYCVGYWRSDFLDPGDAY